VNPWATLCGVPGCMNPATVAEKDGSRLITLADPPRCWHHERAVRLEDHFLHIAPCPVCHEIPTWAETIEPELPDRIGPIVGAVIEYRPTTYRMRLLPCRHQVPGWTWSMKAELPYTIWWAAA
jgi:hypothetical protein